MEVEAAPTAVAMEEAAVVLEATAVEIPASGVEAVAEEVASEGTEDATTAERMVTWQETVLLRLKEDPATSATRLVTSPATAPRPPKRGVSAQLRRRQANSLADGEAVGQFFHFFSICISTVRPYSLAPS